MSLPKAKGSSNRLANETVSQETDEAAAPKVSRTQPRTNRKAEENEPVQESLKLPEDQVLRRTGRPLRIEVGLGLEGRTSTGLRDPNPAKLHGGLLSTSHFSLPHPAA